MPENNDAQWRALEALLKAEPHAADVRMTAKLAKWLVEELQRQQMPVSSIMVRVASGAVP